MERVKTLVEKLQSQLNNNATAAEMLRTVRMLHAELALLSGKNPQKTGRKIAVIMPDQPAGTITPVKKSEELAEEEKVYEILQVDEEEIEKELEEIRQRANSMHAMSHATRPETDFDPISDVPTLAHQNPYAKAGELNIDKIEYPDVTNYEESLNDKLKQVRTELSDSLSASPIKDLRKAIGINDRFQFIKELFRNDESMYERSIKTIQGYSIYPEAEFWIRRELKLKLGWDNNNPTVKQFDELVRRRFL